MFLQKLSLSSEKSYSTSTTLENIIENLHLTFKHIPVIVPYSSKGISQEDLDANLAKETSSSILSVEKYVKNSKSFDCSHVVVLEYDLFEKFGYDLSVLSKPLIVIGSNVFDRLTLCKLHINFEKEDAFVALFILTKLLRGKIVSKKSERVKIFLEVFGIEWECVQDDNSNEPTLDNQSNNSNEPTLDNRDNNLNLLTKPNRENNSKESNQDSNSQESISDSESEESTCDNLECIVFMDGSYSEKYNSLNPERIFVIGGCRPKGFESLKIDLSLAGKYKYRIGDVYRSITPSVMKGKTKFNYEKFKNIAK